MERVEFKPKDLVPVENSEGNWSAPFEHNSLQRERVEKIAEGVGKLFSQSELGVSFEIAMLYVAFGGEDEKYLEYCRLEGDPGRRQKYPKALDKLRDLKHRHPELFE